MKLQVVAMPNRGLVNRQKLEKVKIFYKGMLSYFPSTTAIWSENKLTSIQHGGVLGHTLGMVSESGCVYPGGYSFSRNWASRGEYLVKDGCLQLNSPVSIKLSGKALILGVASHFGHFHVDLLDRMTDRCLEEYDWVVIDKPHRNFCDWLSFYGLNIPDQKLLIPSKNEIFWFDSICCYSGRSIKPFWAPDTINSILGKSVDFKNHESCLLLFVTRQSASTRKILNHERLEAELPEFAFLDMAEPRIFEQVRAFSQASVVVGPIGSDLFNIIHCKPGTKVICIVDIRYLAAFGDNAVMIQSIVDRVGLDLTFLAVDGIDKNPYNANFTVDYKELRQILRSF